MPAFLAWQEAEAIAGPARSYRLACKLAVATRGLDFTTSTRATWALARTKFWKGRFEDSRDLLAGIDPEKLNLAAISQDEHPKTHPEARLELLIPAQLSWSLAMLGDTDNAIAQAQRVVNWAKTQSEPACATVSNFYLASLYCLLDAPEDTRIWSQKAQKSDTANPHHQEHKLIATLLEYWALSRLPRPNQPNDEAAAQTALAELRRTHPAHEARAFSLYAQAQFHQTPAMAVTQLDAALDMNARFGLHHWDARLLHLKSRSLDASGQLSEASRFLELAREVAQKQNARLFLNDITRIESRTYGSPHLESAT